jgi:hypothetical protein
MINLKCSECRRILIASDKLDVLVNTMIFCEDCYNNMLVPDDIDIFLDAINSLPKEQQSLIFGNLKKIPVEATNLPNYWHI